MSLAASSSARRGPIPLTYLTEVPGSSISRDVSRRPRECYSPQNVSDLERVLESGLEYVQRSTQLRPRLGGGPRGECNLLPAGEVFASGSSPRSLPDRSGNGFGFLDLPVGVRTDQKFGWPEARFRPVE